MLMLPRALPVLSVAFSLVAACSSSTATDDTSGGVTDNVPQAVLGTYTVKTVNGSPLPAFITQTGKTVLTLNSATFTIESGRVFSNTSNYTRADDRQTQTTFTETCTGGYSMNGSSMTFTEGFSDNTCGGTYKGTWNGASRITLTTPNEVVIEK